MSCYTHLPDLLHRRRKSGIPRIPRAQISICLAAQSNSHANPTGRKICTTEEGIFKVAAPLLQAVSPVPQCSSCAGRGLMLDLETLYIQPNDHHSTISETKHEHRDGKLGICTRVVRSRQGATLVVIVTSFRSYLVVVAIALSVSNSAFAPRASIYRGFLLLFPTPWGFAPPFDP
ncbi:hypothetical protein BDV96DRAFT_224747 [Lophiotrema nucula]|uniref:Uncharacterized protein n=1 Tax=Lophiotrema nucula TaxID=690887 RepID=A0A6A5YTB1_9PLEO|nr:hypothetical protein BDV96DRAFT_224747 [Lophiotrema nucula]